MKSVRAIFRATVVALTFGTLASHLFAAPPPAKPNFIFINIDDLGYADIGRFGSKLNRTPHFDRTAADLGLDGPAPGSRPLGRVENARPLIEFDK